MNPKIDQPIIDLQDRINNLIVDNLRLKSETVILRNELLQLKEASEDVIVYYHAVDHKYDQFKQKLIKLKHLIK